MKSILERQLLEFVATGKRRYCSRCSAKPHDGVCLVCGGDRSICSLAEIAKLKRVEKAVAVFLDAELVPVNQKRRLEEQRQALVGIQFKRASRRRVQGDGLKKSRRSKIDQFLAKEVSDDLVITFSQCKNSFWSHQVEALLNTLKTADDSIV